MIQFNEDIYFAHQNWEVVLCLTIATIDSVHLPVIQRVHIGLKDIDAKNTKLKKLFTLYFFVVKFSLEVANLREKYRCLFYITCGGKLPTHKNFQFVDEEYMDNSKRVIGMFKIFP